MGNNNHFDNRNKNYSNNKNNSNQFNGKKLSSGYVGAPYNFIPVSQNVISVDKSVMTNRNVLSDELLTGEIEYEINTLTPIFIDNGVNGNHRFFKNEKGSYAIPGSSIRGLIRNNVQILGLSSFREDIDDYNLMYRNVAMGIEKKSYNDILGNKQVSVDNKGNTIGVLLNVKAGYIAKRGKDYVIYKTDVDSINQNFKEMNYYCLSERTIANACKNKNGGFEYLVKNMDWLQHDVQKGFRKEEGWDKRTHYIGNQINKEYKPSYYPISYELKNQRIIVGIDEPNKLKHEGYLVCTGPMREKKALYVIPKLNKEKEPIIIPKADIDSFKIDFESKKNTLKRHKNVDFFNLPKKENEIKPVFYIFLEGRLYFGFTPRLRLFYKYSIMDGFKQDCNVKFDYAKSMFGCIDEQNAGYKSKISFSDAIAYGPVEEDKTHNVNLGSPKPTSYLDYLKQYPNLKDITYNSNDFELRGIKQYWLRENTSSCTESDKPQFASQINALKSGVRFKGKVRFKGLTEKELGLLLWSINLEKNSVQNIGKGKAFGFGAIKFENCELKIVDNSKAYSLDKSLDWTPFKDGVNVDDYINQYKISDSIISADQGIKDFLLMKNWDIKPKQEKIRYMNLNLKEYSKRNSSPLQTVEELVEK